MVLASPHRHRASAELALEHGAHVVSVCDDPAEVRALLGLDAEARERALSVVVGAAFAPGLTCVLARHAVAGFDSVDEIHVASLGTGGPACARHHHAALSGDAVDWRDGAWRRRAGGSGRELCWFPDPVGGADCYRAGMSDAMLLVPAFPGVRRVTARMAASRRDRLTAWLPMLRRPHPEGALGAVRVEVRGTARSSQGRRRIRCHRPAGAGRRHHRGRCRGVGRRRPPGSLRCRRTGRVGRRAGAVPAGAEPPGGAGRHLRGQRGRRRRRHPGVGPCREATGPLRSPA